MRIAELPQSREPGDMYASVFVYTTASVTSATPRADPRINRSSCSQSARWSKRAMNFSVAGDCTSFAALAMVPTYLFVTYRLSGTLGRLCKLDLEQHCKWIVYGSDGLGGKGCTRMRPEVAPARALLGTLSESLVSWHTSES